MTRKTHAQLKAELADALVLTGKKSADRLPDERQLKWIEECMGIEGVERVLRVHGAEGERLLKAWRARRYPVKSGKSAPERSGTGEVAVYKTALRRIGKNVVDDAAAGTGYPSRPGSYPPPSRDPKFLIADDAQRLQAKADALKMPAWGHHVLVMNYAMAKIERAYDGALNTPSGKARKSTDPAIQRDLQRAALVEAGIPEAVLDQLAIQFGDDGYTGVLAALARHMGSRKMYGKGVQPAPRQSPPVKEKTVQHPTFGRVKALTPAPGKPKEEYEMHPTFGRIRKQRR